MKDQDVKVIHQMKLSRFCEEFDMDRNNIYELAARRDFPAYKIGGRWYVDIDKFYLWREQNGEPTRYFVRAGRSPTPCRN